MVPLRILSASGGLQKYPGGGGGVSRRPRPRTAAAAASLLILGAEAGRGHAKTGFREDPLQR